MRCGSGTSPPNRNAIMPDYDPYLDAPPPAPVPAVLAEPQQMPDAEANQLVATVRGQPVDQAIATCDWSNSPAHRARKDWGPLRTLAAKRAYVQLVKHWEDVPTGRRIWNARYRRFCYKDHEHALFSIGETPTSLCFRTRKRKSREWLTTSHYTVSFKGGRVGFYSKRGKGVRRIQPFTLDLMTPIVNNAMAYPEVSQRFNVRVMRMVRAKARANGVRLPKAESTEDMLMAAMYPGVAAVAAQTKAMNNAEWEPRWQTLDRWLMRHMRVGADGLPKAMTGYGSKAVKRLFWESLKSPIRLPNTPSWTTTASLWREKWAWLALLRTWLPVDFTQAILRAEKIAGWDDAFLAEPARVRKFLKQWTPKQVVRTLTETCADSATIRDTIRMLHQREAREGPWGENERLPPLPRTGGPNELHDFLTGEQTRRWEEQRRLREAERMAAMTPEARARWEAEEAARNAAATEPFKHSDRLRAVDGKVVITASDSKVYTIVLPVHGEDLSAWGSAMRNCIGGYAWAVRAGNCQLLGVKTEGSERAIDWGIEVVDGSIRQFRGLCNADAPAELRAAVTRVLEDAGLLAKLSVEVGVALEGAEAGEVFQAQLLAA